MMKKSRKEFIMDLLKKAEVSLKRQFYREEIARKE